MPPKPDLKHLPQKWQEEYVNQKPKGMVYYTLFAEALEDMARMCKELHSDKQGELNYT